MRRMSLLVLGVLLAVCAFGADLPKPEPTPGRVMLPQEHQYQRVLRAYMATLTEKDFEHGVTAWLTMPASRPDPEWRYRQLLYAMMPQPLIGGKRGTPSINAPARLYTLAEIEGADAVLAPPCYPDALISFVQWDYEGNPYHDNRGLKLRAFTSAALNLIMLDAWLDANPGNGRSDWFAYQLVYIGSPYLGFRDLLPEPVRAAYRTGVRRLADRILAWGVRGEEANMDMIAPVGLWYAAQVVEDAAFTQRIEAYARMTFTDRRYFHPAGFWVERGGMELGFGGMANLFAVWAALASEWPFAREAVDRVYRLRAHLILRDPDGTLTGPSHFNNRLGSPAFADQWDWYGGRDYAASLVTDEALHLTHPITLTHPTKGTPRGTGQVEELLADAAAFRAEGFNGGIKENPVGRFDGKSRFLENHEIRSWPWTRRTWMTWDYPLSLNPGYEFYPRGAWARRQRLEQEHSPMLKSPFERGESFVRNFANAFIVAHNPGFTAILHTGPVGRQHPEEINFQYHAPLGFGGGQLSAFRTPQAGAVLQGHRSGQSWDNPFDHLEQWRLWPIHAVSGQTAAGTIFTSARIADPHVATKLQETGGAVTVSGRLVALRAVKDPHAADPNKARTLIYDAEMASPIDYTRAFVLDRNGVTVTTTLTGDGKESIAELYETLPVYHRRDHRREGAETAITVQVGRRWVEVTEEPVKNVAAIRLARFDGTVEVRFDRPRTVKLAPEAWRGEFLTRALCRTILIDWLENDGKPAALRGERRISYTIRAVTP